ncbi:MAG: CCA tRNA nucleotidyltransferase [Myxococcota bacterium]
MNLLLPLPNVVERLGQRVHEAGGRCFVVGGGVRDHLLQIAVKDWDIEVFGLDLDALEAVLRRIGRVNAVGRSFGVFKLTHNGAEIDVSIPRRDSNSGPGHRGIEVEGDPYMSFDEAVTRRDLTINAMMVDVVTGELIDLADGHTDLKARRLRAVNANTFLEDPLRALRAVQFAARFEFQADAELRDLCRAAALQELPPERIQGEWLKLFLRGSRPSVGLQLARDTDQLQRVFPALRDAPNLDTAVDLAVASTQGLEPPGRRLGVLLLVWLSQTPTQDVEAVLDALGLHRWGGYPVRDQLLRAHAELDTAPADVAQLRHMSTRCHLGLTLTAQAALRPEGPAESNRADAHRLSILWGPPKPWVLGRDVLACGVAPSPAVGQWLARLYQAQLDGVLSGREEALAQLKTWLDEA